MSKKREEKRKNKVSPEMRKVRKKRKKIILSIIAGVLVLAIAGGGFFWWHTESTNYVAKINGYKISLQEYMFNLRSQKQSLESQNLTTGTVDEKRTYWESTDDGIYTNEPNAPQGRSREDALKQKVLDQMCTSEIEYQNALKANPKAYTDDYSNVKSQILSNWQQQNNQTQADLEQYLQTNYKISFNYYAQLMTKQQVISDYVSNNASAITVSDDDVSSFYNDNKDSLDLIKFKRILYPTVDLSTQQTLSTDEVAQAKSDADAAVTKVQQDPTVIDQLITDESQDPNKSTDNGEASLSLDPSNTQNYYEPISSQLANMSPGDVQSIYVDGLGYYVVLYESRTTFDDVKDNAKTALQNQLYGQQMDDNMRSGSLVLNGSIMANIDMMNI